MRAKARVVRYQLDPAETVVLSFGGAIGVATLLLWLPISSATGESIRFIDAFFTAVSATCVTGLTVIDTGIHFSPFGELVILACIQIGGLGLMVFTTVFLMLTARRLRIADRVAVQESYSQGASSSIRNLVLYIVGATLVTEAIATVVLALHWWSDGRFDSLLTSFYYAAFHAVSAFCNAGFALFPDSAVRFQQDVLTQLVLTSLIVAGGVGFLVTLDVKQYLEQRYFRRHWSTEVEARVSAIRPRPRLSLHSKLVLITTGALLVIGTVSYYLLERNGVLAGMGTGYAWLNAYFTSVTARTAGFNTVDFSQMGGPALLCTMVLMFIGASPGSTGGGIKTSTFALLIVYAVTRWRGRTTVHAFGRTVPRESRDRAGAVVVLGVALVVLAASAMIAVETRGRTAEESQQLFLPVLFETVSAFGTVGLSLGHTPELTDWGRLILSVLMFMGRVGPLTLALAIGRREQREHYHYAEENIMVG